MSFHKKILSSFANDERLAVCSPDGVMHVCNLKIDEQKHKQLQPMNLPAIFTCLTWMADCIPQGIAGRKKRLSKSQCSKSGELIALGTAGGDIILFNAFKREIFQKYSEGHSDRVNCISLGKGNTFYSCSSDRHIVEWSLNDTTHKSKWKAEKGEVNCIAVGPYLKTMLSAGKLIKLWDLKSKQLLRKYAGHGTPVFSLSFLSTSSMTSQGASGLELVDGLYFLSAAEDKTLSAWQIKHQKHKKTAACTFSLPSGPCLVDVMSSQTPDKPSQVLAVTDDQQIVLFSYVLNGHTKKPLAPAKSIQIVTEDTNPLKVICASFKKDSKDSATTVNIAYGDVAEIAFEQVNIDDHADSNIVLVRNHPVKGETFMEQDKMEEHVVVTDTKASLGKPGELETSRDKKSRRKRKSKLPSDAQLTMEERLQALSPEKEHIEEQPSSQECATLLAQGLQGGDEIVLNRLFQLDDMTLVTDTIRLLSLSHVIPLIKELSRRFRDNPARCLIAVKWMKGILELHSAYIITFPDVTQLLAGLPHLLDARSQVHRRVLLAQGKLELIMSQVTTRQAAKENSNEALFVFEDESSDEQDYMEGVMPSHSDSFEEWDDFSDAEDDNVTGEQLSGGDELMIDEG